MPETACAVTVATAAPLTPILFTRIRSSMIFNIEENIRNTTGVKLSPERTENTGYHVVEYCCRYSHKYYENIYVGIIKNICRGSHNGKYVFCKYTYYNSKNDSQIKLNTMHNLQYNFSDGLYLWHQMPVQ